MKQIGTFRLNKKETHLFIPLPSRWRAGGRATLVEFVRALQLQPRLVAAAGMAHNGTKNWVEEVNTVQTEMELDAVRRCIERGCPYGSATWIKAAVERMGRQYTVRPPESSTEGRR